MGHLVILDHSQVLEVQGLDLQALEDHLALVVHHLDQGVHLGALPCMVLCTAPCTVLALTQ